MPFARSGTVAAFVSAVISRESANARPPDVHCTVYRSAPSTASQLTSRRPSPRVATTFAGAARTGVVAVTAPDHSLSPAVLLALTRTMKAAPLASGDTVALLVVTAVSRALENDSSPDFHCTV